MVVDNTGAVSVSWVAGEGAWAGPLRITGPNFAPPGARGAAANQTSMNQLDAVVVDNTGAVSVLWVIGEGAWAGPLRITGPNFAPPGASVALVHQGSMNQLDAVVVDNAGAVSVLWVAGEGAWTGPLRITGPSFAPPGANVALANQTSMNQLDAVVVDNTGAVSVLWVIGEGAWAGPLRISGPNFAPPGANVALAHQVSMNQLDAVVVDNTGAVSVLWVIGEGAWAGPLRITGPNSAPAGASVALANQTSMSQLDAMVADNTGAVSVLWVIGEGAWAGPLRITGQGYAKPNASVALGHQTSMNQLNGFVVDVSGEVSVSWVQGEGSWQGPIRLPGPVIVP